MVVNHTGSLFHAFLSGDGSLCQTLSQANTNIAVTLLFNSQFTNNTLYDSVPGGDDSTLPPYVSGERTGTFSIWSVRQPVLLVAMIQARV